MGLNLLKRFKRLMPNNIKQEGKYCNQVKPY